MKKLGLLTLIVISSVFLMSHNASAITMTFDATQYTPVVRQVYNLVDCSFVVGNNTYYQNSVSNCYSTQGALSPNVVKVKKIVTSNSITFKKGDIVEFDIIAYHDPAAYFENFSFRAFKLNNVNDFYMMGYDSVLNLYGHDSWVNSSGNAIHYHDINQIMRFRVYVQNDIYTPIGLYATDTNYNPIATYNEASQDIKWNLINLTVYRKTGKSSVNQEQEEATQDAADDSQTSGDSSQDSAESATQSLLTTINNGIGVITSARATNCQIDGDIGNLDLGNLDLCANPVPTFVQIILSLVAVVTVIPLAIVLFNRFIGIFRSFQG